jgi:hypothetical protein
MKSEAPVAEEEAADAAISVTGTEAVPAQARVVGAADSGAVGVAEAAVVMAAEALAGAAVEVADSTTTISGIDESCRG